MTICTLRCGEGIKGGLSNMVGLLHTWCSSGVAQYIYSVMGIARASEKPRGKDVIERSTSIIPVWTCVNCLVVGWVRNVTISTWTTLLCLSVISLLICLLVQHERKCQHLSIWWGQHGPQTKSIWLIMLDDSTNTHVDMFAYMWSLVFSWENIIEPSLVPKPNSCGWIIVD